jgi:hypothetical protein
VPAARQTPPALPHRRHAFGVRCRFLTTTKGVDPSHRDKAFYRPTLDRDTTRVNSLFDRAHDANIDIEYRSLSPSELRSLCGGGAHTRGGNLVIGLVDGRRLYRPAQTSDQADTAGGAGIGRGDTGAEVAASSIPVGASGPFRRLWVGTGLNQHVASVLNAIRAAANSVCNDCLGAGGYVGHYVLITSYDSKRRGYYILDPAGVDGLAFIPDEAMSAARRSHGTDEDLLIIPWDQPAPRYSSGRGGNGGATQLV